MEIHLQHFLLPDQPGAYILSPGLSGISALWTEPVFLTQTVKTFSTSGGIISNSVFLGGFRVTPKELFAQNSILPSLFPDLRWV